jgi:hypothetical protein
MTIEHHHRPGESVEKIMRGLCLVGLLAVLMGLGGCGGDGLKRVPVQGKVTSQGGTPIPNAVISFVPMSTTKGEGGIATADQDGSFTLIGSRRGDKGVVAGKYKVRVSRFVERDGSPLPADWTQADHPHAKETVPPPYSGMESPLEVTVPEAGGTVNVEVPVKVLEVKKK